MKTQAIKKLNKERKKPICPVCGSACVLYRHHTGTYMCRRCGYIATRDELFFELL